MDKKINLTKLLYFFILSVICFSVIITKLKIDVYTTIYATILVLIMLVLDNKKNANYIFRALCFGTTITLGYLASKALEQNCDVTNYFNGEKYRWMITGVIVVEYVYILFRYKKFCDDQGKNTTFDNEIFSEREEDIKRLGEYIQKYDTIGINGEWGSGKTYLVDEFIRRNQKDYEVIKIETLTCKLDNIDLYIFKQLENVLWRNRIYPRYSRQIQNFLDQNGIIKQLREIFIKGSLDKSTAFNGFCEDIHKVTKTILLVCEDIDRISENYVDEVAKILDISAKLAGNNVKVIYEYDQEKMSAMGFDQEYMEKYIPYVINLTDIPFMRLVKNALEEEKSLNGHLTQEDFRFLTLPIYADYFLKKTFGIHFSMTIRLNRITPRKVKEFVAEVNLAMNKEVFALKENRKVVIAFFYLKIFMWQLYEKLSFEDDIQNEIRFQRNITTGDTVKSYYFSIMELVHMLKKNEMNTNDLKQMFSANVNEMEEVYVAENRNKLTLLHILKFDFKELQKLYEAAQYNGDKKKERNPILDEKLQTTQSIEHNIKINRLIKNLYMNGKSEYTDNEANAMLFIDKVLFAKKEVQEKEWHEYVKRCFNTELYKDNETIFMLWGDNLLSLAKAIRIVIENPKYLKKRSAIKECFFDFWKKYREDNKIVLETVKAFRLIEPDDQKSFIKAITYFNTLEISGNMNDEDIYIDFLEKYISIAYRLGYIYGEYVQHLIEEMHWEKDKNGERLGRLLVQIQEMLQREIVDGMYPEETRSEFEAVSDFLKKNIEIVKMEKVAEQRKLDVSVSISEQKNYKNETVYNELMNMPNNVSLEAFRHTLDEAYENGNISLREYRVLLEKRNSTKRT